MRTIIVASALIALSTTPTSPADELTFGITAGESVAKRFESSFEAAFDQASLTGTNDGRTIERAVDMNSSVQRQIVLALTDHYEALAADRGLRLRREVNAAHRKDETVVQGQPAPTSESDSLLLDETVLVEWDEDDEAYSFASADEAGEELDERLFATLRADADLRFLLPGKEVSPGDEWTVAPEHLLDLVLPGGDPFPFLSPEEKLRAPEDQTELQLSAPFAGMTIPPFQWLAAPEGTILVTYQGLDEGEPGLALLAFELLIEGSLDPTERLDYHVARGMPAFIDYEYSHELDYEINGEGILRWDLERGILHDVEWSAQIEGAEDIHLAAKFEHPRTGEPVEVEMAIEGDWKGAYEMSGGRRDG